MTTLDLPTEAQWEYACRAGTQAKQYFGDEDGRLYAVCQTNISASVGTKIPNQWGLYDTLGNAAEMTRDLVPYWQENAQEGLRGEVDDFGPDPVVDPLRLINGTDKNASPIRGGNFFENLGAHRAASRRSNFNVGTYDQAIGFRLSATLQ